MKKYYINTRKGSNMLYLNLGGKRFSTGIHDTSQGRRLVRGQAEKAIREELETEGIIHKPPVTEIRDLAEKYFDYLEIQGKAWNTLRIYCDAFKTVNYKQSYEVNKAIIYNKLEKLRINKTTKNCTYNTRVRRIGTFLKWAFAYEYVSELISVKRFYLVEEMKEPIPYTKEELQHILLAAEKHTRELFLLLNFLTSTGFRIQESLKLKFTDFNLTTKLIQIPNKIQKVKIQVFPITTKVQDIYQYNLKIERIRRNTCSLGGMKRGIEKLVVGLIILRKNVTHELLVEHSMDFVEVLQIIFLLTILASTWLKYLCDIVRSTQLSGITKAIRPKKISNY